MTFPYPSRLLAKAAASPARAVPQLVIEARKARAFGKPLAAALMMALARTLPRVPELFDRIENWPCDLAADGVIFRLNAGLHALALTGRGGVLGRGLSSGNGGGGGSALTKAGVQAAGA